ncbi:MAG: hypothetical protein ACREQT_02900 [Candidatus Binataceae bacterium]
MFPSVTIMILGSMITVVLAIVNWGLWRNAPILPYPATTTIPQFALDDGSFKEVA